MLTCLAMMENNLIDFLQARSLNNNPEDFVRQLLAKRDFSAASALRLVDLLPRDSGLRRVQGHGGSRLGLGAYWGTGKLAVFKSTYLHISSVVQISVRLKCTTLHQNMSLLQ